MKKIICQFFQSVLFLATFNVAASPADVNIVANWVKSLQYTNASLPSYGAIKVHHTAAIGTYYRVNPYFANLGVIGLLETKTSSAFSITERWIQWYLKHINTREGVPYEHFYSATGGNQTTCIDKNQLALCNYNDATDSAISTFFDVLWSYYQISGKQAANFLKAGNNKIAFESLANTLLKLQQSDGLSFAKNSYQIKYLMDNCEVFRGLQSIANLEANLFRDTVKANAYKNAATKVKNGILTYLYVPGISLYLTAVGEDQPDLGIWYPDTKAQVWPHLFGVVSVQSTQTKTVMTGINNTWDGRTRANWALTPELIDGGYLSTDVGYAALLAGDGQHAQIHTDAVKHLKFPTSPNDIGFAWPFTVGDAGWLIQSLNKFP